MAVTLKGRISLDWSQVKVAMRGTQMAVRGFVNVTGRGLYDMGARLQRFGLIWGSVGAGIAAWGVKKAGEFEMLKLRLETAMGSAIKAKAAWTDTFKLAIESPLELEPLVKGRILLENFGMTGGRALRAVASAAVLTARQVEDVAAALGSMEAEPLRRMGIQARSRTIRGKDGNDVTKFRLAFRDRQQVKYEFKVVGIEEARRAVLRIFEIKYGGGLDKMAKTWQGVWSTFTDSATYAFSQVSDALKIQLIPYLDRLNQWLQSGIQTGTFVRFGQFIYRWVGGFLRHMHAMIMAWNAVTVATRDQLQNCALALAAFIIAWKAGFVEVMLKSLGFIVTTWAWAFATMTGLLTGFASFVVGYKIGVAMEKGFNLSSMLLKWGATLKEMGGTLVASFDIWARVAVNAGKAIWKGLKGDAAGAMESYDEMLDRWEGFVDRFDPAQMKARLNEAFAKIDEVSGGPDTRSFDDKLAETGKELKRQFATVQGWVESLGVLVPDSVKKYIAELGNILLKLPAVKLSDGLLGGTRQIKDDLGAAADAAGKMKKMLEPLRGFSTGALGAGGGLKNIFRRRELPQPAGMNGGRWQDPWSERRVGGRKIMRGLLPNGQWPAGPASTAPATTQPPPQAAMPPRGGFVVPPIPAMAGASNMGSGSVPPEGMKASGEATINAGRKTKSAYDLFHLALTDFGQTFTGEQNLMGDRTRGPLGVPGTGAPGLLVEAFKRLFMDEGSPGKRLGQSMYETVGTDPRAWFNTFRLAMEDIGNEGAKLIMGGDSRQKADRARIQALQGIPVGAAAAPLMKQGRKAANGAAGGTSGSNDLGSMPLKQDTTNTLLRDILKAKAAFSFA